MPMRTMSWGLSLVMSGSRKTMRPSRGWFRPWIERSVVDLPAPFAPISVTTSPSRTSSEMPLSAWIVP